MGSDQKIVFYKMLLEFDFREEIDFLETGRFRPRAVTFGLADLILLPKNYLREVGLVLKIS